MQTKTAMRLYGRCTSGTKMSAWWHQVLVKMQTTGLIHWGEDCKWHKLSGKNTTRQSRRHTTHPGATPHRNAMFPKRHAHEFVEALSWILIAQWGNNPVCWQQAEYTMARAYNRILYSNEGERVKARIQNSGCLGRGRSQHLPFKVRPMAALAVTG